MFQVHDGKLGSFDTVVLSDERFESRVTIVPARGALATSFFAHGREWLYLDEATILDPTQNVRGGIPVLFPSPGKLEGDRFAYGGKSGAMKQHGFARTTGFRETGRGTNGSAWVEAELADSSATRSAFPWCFRLRLRFMLDGARLTIHAEVDNTGVEPLPFALGYHPYFAVPSADKGRCRIPTRAKRAWDNVRKRESALEPIDLASGEVDLHLIDHDSNGATLEAPAGSIDLGGHFTRWVVWTLPSRDFVCLEPWTAPANALSSGEGLITLPPGAGRRLSLDIAVRRA
jgi:galactose mutarotase-like enzyme